MRYCLYHLKGDVAGVDYQKLEKYIILWISQRCIL